MYLLCRANILDVIQNQHKLLYTVFLRQQNSYTGKTFAVPSYKIFLADRFASENLTAVQIKHAMGCVLNSLEELGFIECSLEPERHVETVRVIFFASTPLSKRQEGYYCKMIRHIVMNLYKKNIRYNHIKIDWSPEL